VEASISLRPRGIEGSRFSAVTAGHLPDEGKEREIMRAELGAPRGAGVQLLGVDRARRFREVFVLRHERQGKIRGSSGAERGRCRCPREADRATIELRGRRKRSKRPDHFDEDRSTDPRRNAQVGHGAKTNPATRCDLGDNKLPLGPLVALLSTGGQGRPARSLQLNP